MRPRSILRSLQAAHAAYDQQCLTIIAQSVRPSPAVEQAVQVVQPGIDYTAWVRRQQAWRGFAAAPARIKQDNMEEVAERKLAEARSRHEALQKAIAGTIVPR